MKEFPPDFAISLDSGSRRIDDRIDDRTVLVGGSPLRLLRLSARGSQLVDRLAAGEPIPPDRSSWRLARRLLQTGLAHPRPATGSGPYSAHDVTVVIPVRDQTDGLKRLLAETGVLDDVAKVVVVDDSSSDAREVRRICKQASSEERGDRIVELVRNEIALGPGAARNKGVDLCSTDLVAFFDADCVPQADWTTHLLSHFADSCVAAVAPRVRPGSPVGYSDSGSDSGEDVRDPHELYGRLLMYEELHSPLDLGQAEDYVRPGGRVPYVPTAALLVRRDVLDRVGGFDSELRVGEDVDLVWRIVESGWTVIYEPTVTATHDIRRGLIRWLLQRFAYGTSAAPLAKRHPGALAPLRISGWSAAVWGLIGSGHPVAGASVAGVTTALLTPRLEELRHPLAESARITGTGHAMAGRLIGHAIRRVWWPVALAASLPSRRVRRVIAAAFVIPPLIEWVTRRPKMNPVRWCAMRVADDLSYGAGVWVGCWRERSLAPLLPDFSNWPGRSSAVEGAVADQRTCGPTTETIHSKPTETDG
ncbi:MAG TPA: mycofactocin biosynthesis glycosyltransferase MftF [Acidimicrobiales bacterium]|nr:mycofactocin biosynthesis glycosyltransferase MftF [Acidimicrobiales bacterium]